MSLIYMFVFNLILFNGCLSVNIHQVSPQIKVQQQNRSENILREDFIYPIFESSDLEDIIEFEKNPRVSQFVKEIIFPANYMDYRFRINAHDNADFERNIASFTYGFHIRGYNFSMDFIKTFGKSIQKLYIQNMYHVNDKMVSAVFQAIQEYCSNELRLLSLEFITENALMELKKPFPNVQELNVYINEYHLGPTLSINKLFPKLNRLSLKFRRTLKYAEFIESELPNLEHLDISMQTNNNSIAYKQLENLFRKNPQIRSLNYEYDLGDFIQVINDCLPNLEYLSTQSLDSNIQPLQLDHVKYFSASALGIESPFERLSFSRLESLSLNYYQDYEGRIFARDSWMKFFKNHQNLKEINCTAFTDVELPEFLAELPNLTKIQIKSQRNFGIDFVCGLIEMHKNLLNLQYEIDMGNHPEVSDLANYLENYGNDWKITHFITENVSTYTFQKKI